jgi:hypothetical protein
MNVDISSILAWFGVAAGFIVLVDIAIFCFLVWFVIKGYKLATSPTSTSAQKYVGAGMMIFIAVIVIIGALTNDGSNDQTQTTATQQTVSPIEKGVFFGKSCVTKNGAEDCIESNDPDEYAKLREKQLAPPTQQEREKRMQEAIRALQPR